MKNWTNSYEYTYPKDADGRELDLRPGSDLHEKLLSALNDRIKRGYASGREARENARKLDHLQTAYVPSDTKMNILELDADPKAPFDVVIPVSRANLDTMVAFAGNQFFGDGSNMYPLDARSDPESIVKAAKMERLLHMQSQWFQHKLSHFTSLRDSFLYGMSCKVPVWAKHKRRNAVTEEVSEVLYELLKDTVPGVSPGDVIRYLEDEVYHEGSELKNVDFYSLIIDPYATLNEYQKAEFLGFWERTNAMDILKRESDPEERLFNGKYAYDLCKQSSGRSTTQWTKESGRFDRIGVDDESEVPGHPDTNTTNPLDIANLFWTLIPSEWGLSDSDQPEIWSFKVSGDEVILAADNTEYDSGGYQMLFDGPQTCGYDMFPVSSLAATFGLHQFIDWKVRMHYWNASRCNNSEVIFDSSVLNADDWKASGPGKMVRLRRPLVGDETIQKFYHQIQLQDFTGDYPSHVQAMMNFGEYVTGTNAMMQGDMSGLPDRPTQFGMQAAQQAGSSRLGKDCQTITEQSYYELVRRLCHNNTQFMEHEMVVNILGSRYEEKIRVELGLAQGLDDVTVSPWDLDMNTFEISPRNRMRQDADLGAMGQMMERMLSIPEIAMEAFGGTDVHRLFLHMIRRMGFENVHQFQKAGGQMPQMNAQVMPDAQVEQQLQAGNVVPAGGVNG